MFVIVQTFVQYTYTHPAVQPTLHTQAMLYGLLLQACTKQQEIKYRWENDMIKRGVKLKMHESAAGISQHTVLQHAFFS